MDPIEPIEIPQTSAKPKVPRMTRSIPWLGGASFGRSKRREKPESAPELRGAWSLVLIQVGLVVVPETRYLMDERICLALSTVLLVLCGLWLKRYYKTTTPFLRVAAAAMIAMQLLLILPLYIFAILPVRP
jgi:hypothetical protein